MGFHMCAEARWRSGGGVVSLGSCLPTFMRVFLFLPVVLKRAPLSDVLWGTNYSFDGASVEQDTHKGQEAVLRAGRC